MTVTSSFFFNGQSPAARGGIDEYVETIQQKALEVQAVADSVTEAVEAVSTAAQEALGVKQQVETLSATAQAALSAAQTTLGQATSLSQTAATAVATATQNASDASLAKSSAALSESNASASAASAATAVTAATTKAGEAATSAAAAAGSATSAANSASSAATTKTAADASASAAQASANAALSQATAAASSATSAQGSATSAASSAATASTKATEASGSATTAANSAASAAASATNAAGSATAADGSATNAANSASAAAASASNAASAVSTHVGAADPHTQYIQKTGGTFSGAVTYSPGTANGIAYLNGSKVLTTGSALTFDGSSFVTTAATTAYAKVRSSGSGTVAASLYQNANTGTTDTDGFFVGTIGDTPYLYNYENSPLIFGTNNTEAMRLTSTGLGLGNSSPGARLDVASGSVLVSEATNQTAFNRFVVAQYTTAANTSVNNVFTVGNRSNNSFPDRGASIKFVQSGTTNSLGELASTIQFWTWGLGVDNGAERARITSGGNLLVGTTSDFGSRLHINRQGATQNQPVLTWTDNEDNTGYLGIRSASEGGGENGASIAADGALFFGRMVSGSYTERARITSGGNLLVGHTAELGGLNREVLVNAASGSAGINFSVAASLTARIRSESASTEIGTVNSAPLIFNTANAERARITSGGDLLVGATDTLAFNPGVRISPTDLKVTNTSATSTVYLAYLNRQSSDGEALRFGRANSTVGTIAVTTTATAYNTSSDYRLKNNPQPLTGSGAFIDALKPKTWNWTADGSRGVGFIAHEVQEVSPGSVTGTKDAVDEEGKPMYQTMEYGSSEFIANIIAELQSLRARVAALETK